ncbi:DUF4406 domain-containing protein [Citrobacter braakii]|nr:DUF4406 domain-containing protein [Citrobacter braakii]
MRKIYIAGPMTGLPDFNRPAFKAAALDLSLQGNAVLNPATLPDGLSQAEYMDICVAMIRCADAIYLLQNWEQSLGARAEIALARKLELEIIFQDEQV